MTQQNFLKGIRRYAKAGNHLADISSIQGYAEALVSEWSSDLVGHGIDTEMHEAPEIP